MADFEAVILAGGRGTRLRPLTTLVPKPLVPIGENHSIIDVAIAQLARAGCEHIRIAVGHQSHLIKATIGFGSRWGTRISYIEESSPLGTAGPLTLPGDLPEHFVVMNGDVLCDVDYARLLRRHLESGALLTVGAVSRRVQHEYGVLEVSGSKLVNFGEKPTDTFLVSMGVYGVARELVERYPRGVYLGFDSVINDLIRSREVPHVHKHDGLWFDVGRPDDYDLVNLDADALLRRLLPNE